MCVQLQLRACSQAFYSTQLSVRSCCAVIFYIIVSRLLWSSLISHAEAATAKERENGLFSSQFLVGVLNALHLQGFFFFYPFVTCKQMGVCHKSLLCSEFVVAFS